MAKLEMIKTKTKTKPTLMATLKAVAHKLKKCI